MEVGAETEMVKTEVKTEIIPPEMEEEYLTCKREKFSPILPLN